MSKPLMPWIQNETWGYPRIIDLGARFGDKLNTVWVGAKERFGVEIHGPYIEAGKRRGLIDGVHVKVVQGDMRTADVDGYDLAMMIDTIEHIEKQEGLDLIAKLQQKVKKILLFTPNGFNEQLVGVYDPSADEYEMHRSGWTCEDLEALGFKCEIDPDHHPHYAPGAIFATWVKP